MLVFASCEETAAGTPLTSLTYSASTVDAAKGNPITAVTPTIVPQDATAEYSVSPQLPAGLELSPKSGIISGTPTDAYAAEAVYTVTATGTEGYTGSATAAITIAVGISRNIVVTETAKTNPAEDKRYHYVAFTLQADGTTSMGRHKFALSLKTNPAPTVQEMNDGDGVYRIVNPAEKKVFLSYTLGSGISDLMTDADYLDKMIKHGDQISGTATDVDGYLLSPGKEYSLYALKDGGSSVEELYDFTTDTFDTASTFTGENKHLDTAISGGEYMIDPDDAVFVFPLSLIPSSGSVSSYAIAADGIINASFLFVGGIFGNHSIFSERMILVPSQSISGGNPQVSMSNANIITWYLLVPMNLVEAGKKIDFKEVIQNIDLSVITPTLDQ